MRLWVKSGDYARSDYEDGFVPATTLQMVAALQEEGGDNVTESKLCITHGGFTTILEREQCVHGSARVGACRWVRGLFVVPDEETADI